MEPPDAKSIDGQEQGALATIPEGEGEGAPEPADEPPTLLPVQRGEEIGPVVPAAHPLHQLLVVREIEIADHQAVVALLEAAVGRAEHPTGAEQGVARLARAPSLIRHAAQPGPGHPLLGRRQDQSPDQRRHALSSLRHRPKSVRAWLSTQPTRVP